MRRSKWGDGLVLNTVGPVVEVLVVTSVVVAALPAVLVGSFMWSHRRRLTFGYL